MGRGATAYNYIGVEITLSEFKDWLSKNLSDEDLEELIDIYGDDWNLKSDNYLDFELVCNYAPYQSYGEPKDKARPVASVNWENNEINGLFFAMDIYDVYLYDADGYTSLETIPFEELKKIHLKIQEVFPNKKIELITIQTIG